MGDCCTLVSMTGLIVITGFYIYCGIQCFIKPYLKEDEDIEDIEDIEEEIEQETEQETEKDRNKNIELQNFPTENQPLLTPTIYSQPYKT